MRFFVISFILIGVLSSCQKENRSSFFKRPEDQMLRLNQIQILASHNSYHLRTDDTVLYFLNSVKSLLPSSLNPLDLDYTHEPFDVQMSQYGIRGLELDIYNDPQGGAYAVRHINTIMGLKDNSGIPELNKPGFKVLHIKDIDFNSLQPTFKLSLKAIKEWSDEHPGHLPLFVNVETKTESPGDNDQLAKFGFESAPKFDLTSTDRLDAEVKEVFGDDLQSIITPDKLRGDLKTLNQVVTLNAWPLLGECRGKIMFIMEGEMVSLYKQGRTSLKGRTMFTYESKPNDDAVFIILNDPLKSKTEISTRVLEGYIVRTRADEFANARRGDYLQSYAAFESGAQIVTTDYYRADPRAGVAPGWARYEVKMPNDGFARKNPINAREIDIPSILTE